MSIRLNKVGNIPDAIPLTASSTFGFTGRNGAYFEVEDNPEPFYTPSLLGKQFAGYAVGDEGMSGGSANFVGSGDTFFRDNKGDYFLAAFQVTRLLATDRDTPSLLGVTACCHAVHASSLALPRIYPMFLWTSFSSPVHKTITSYSMVSPAHIARFTSGVTNNECVVKDVFEISPRIQSPAIRDSGNHDVYFGFFVGRPSHRDKSGQYRFSEMAINASFVSLKGNRPVFDPVMV